MDILVLQNTMDTRIIIKEHRTFFTINKEKICPFIIIFVSVVFCNTNISMKKINKLYLNLKNQG